MKITHIFMIVLLALTTFNTMSYVIIYDNTKFYCNNLTVEFQKTFNFSYVETGNGYFICNNTRISTSNTVKINISEQHNATTSVCNDTIFRFNASVVATFTFSTNSSKRYNVYNGAILMITDMADGGSFTLGGDINIVYSGTIPDPPYNGSSEYIPHLNSLNLTWVGGNYSDKYIVKKDGVVVQNNSNTYYNESGVFGSGTYVIYGYNDSCVGHISTGLSIPWLAIGLSCYNESNMAEAIPFGIEITNRQGTQTYVNESLTTTHYIDLLADNVPYGRGTIFVINSTGYRQRIYYYDIYLNHFYNLSFYLPVVELPTGGGGPDEEDNVSRLYRLRVVDENAYPIADAKVNIRKYNNVTGIYTNVSVVETNGYGEYDVWLLPNNLYKVFINKDGFEQTIDEWIPDPIFYGANYPKIFQMLSTQPTIPIYNFWDICNFTANMYTNNSIKVTFLDKNGNTTDAQFYTYENYNFTQSLISTNTTTSSNFIFWVTGINISRSYTVFLYLNHTDLGYKIISIIDIILIPTYNRSEIEEKVENVLGPFSLGYVNTFLIYLPSVLCLILPGRQHPGFGILLCSFYLGITSAFIFNPVTLIPFIVAIGIILMLVKGGKLKL